MSEREDPDVPLNDSIVQRLQRFGTYGRLKQLALRTVRCVHRAPPAASCCVVEGLRTAVVWPVCRGCHS